MKVIKLALVLLAILGLARCDGDDDDVDVIAAKLFIKCIDKALDGGLPSIPIPNHNPLVIRNITYSGSILVGNFTIAVTNNILSNLLDYNFTKIEATSYTNPERVAYDYDLYWPKLTFTGDFELDFDSLLFTTKLNGSYNIVLREIDWTGIFNLTKPGQESQGIAEHVDDFTLFSQIENADVNLTGDFDNVAAEETLKLAVLGLMNNMPASVADAVKDRFNDFWIAQPEKIDAIIENCNS